MTDARISVHITCRSSRNQLLGVADGVLRARVTAAPRDGEANKALCRLIAKRIGIAPSKVEVIRGQKSRKKTVGVTGLDDAELERLLQEPDR